MQIPAMILQCLVNHAVQEAALPLKTRFVKSQLELSRSLEIFGESSFVCLFLRGVRRLPNCCAHLRGRDEEESLSRS